MPQDAKSIAEELLDDIAKHSLELQRVANQVDKLLSAELDKLTADILAILANKDFSANSNPRVRRKMLNDVLRRGKKIINRTSSTLASVVIKELGKVGKLEAQFALGGINQAVTGTGRIVFATKRISKKKISNIAARLIIRGVPQKELWARQGVNLANRFTDVIKDGWVNQQDIPTISARIRGTSAASYKDGIMNVTKHQADSLARTSISSIANQTREEVYLANSDVIQGVKFLAVFDNRTTPICRSYGNEEWFMSGGGFGNGSKGHEYRRPPLHFNCRSTLVPIVKPAEALSSNKLKKVPTNRRDSLGKKVQDPKTADSWLKGQDVAYQKDVLGKAYPGWKAGRISFARMVTQKGRLRSTNELGALYKAKGKI